MEPITTLSEELSLWRDWAGQARHDENGWESDAPNWPQLMRVAKSTLLGEATVQDEAAVEAVFGMSEETEELADFLKSNLNRVPPERIRRLLSSTDPKVRWQVLDSLVNPQGEWLEMLKGGMNDPHDYVRRRAFLRLVESGKASTELLTAAVSDSDSVIRTEAEIRLSYLMRDASAWDSEKA